MDIMFTIIKKLIRQKIIIVAVSLIVATPLATFAKEPKNFIYTSSDDFESVSAILERSDIHGVQIVYNWRLLEPEKDKYDFSKIEKDLSRLKKARKNYLSRSKIDFSSQTPDTSLIIC